MLNIVVYYPVDGDSFNSEVLLRDWPKKIKEKIIEKTVRFFKEEDLSVIFIATQKQFIGSDHPALVLIFCDRRTRSLVLSEEMSECFEKIIDEAIIMFDKTTVFSIHTIFSDSSRVIGLNKTPD
ncbi:MAG: hypothetical protein WCT07_02665 [Candidatus Paceibacterota bacterium]|jgi:hypothetical protein